MHACVHHCIHKCVGVYCVSWMQQASRTIFMTVGLLAACLVSASACKSQSEESRESRRRRKGGGKEKETLLAQIDDHLLAAFTT